jgi:RNA 2',3'-cyclic 3'-phosphodiesterase
MDGKTNTHPKPARIFVGSKIEPQIADQFATFAASLKGDRARLVASRDMHVTLVPPWQETSIEHAIGRLRQVVRAFAPFTIEFRHVGYGPQPGRPNLVWVECAVSDEILALRAALMQNFGQEESRAFRPHVTLARIRAMERNVARKHPIDCDLELAQAVRTIELFQSPPPGKTGYQVLASVELGKPHISAAEN